MNKQKKTIPLVIISIAVVTIGIIIWAVTTKTNLPQIFVGNKTYNDKVDVVDLGIKFKYLKKWSIDIVDDKSFVKILAENQNELAGLTYEEMVEKKELEEITDFPIYIRAKATTEIPFFARLQHLSSLGMDYPEKRGEVDDFIPGYKTLKTVGKRGPGTFFITQNGQTIFEFYRPNDEESIKVFNDILKSFSFTKEPLNYLTEADLNNYTITLRDKNFNMWMYNPSNGNFKKIAERSATDSIYGWLPNLARVIYKPIYRIQSFTYGYTDVTKGESTHLNEQISVAKMYDLQLLPSGNLTFYGETESIPTGIFDENGMEEYITKKPLYISDSLWEQAKTVGDPTKTIGKVSWSPDEDKVIFESGSDYGTERPNVTLFDISEDTYTDLGKGANVKWLDDQRFAYNTVDDKSNEYSFVIKNVITNNVITISEDQATDFCISPDSNIITYSIYSGEGNKKWILQYNVLDQSSDKVIDYEVEHPGQFSCGEGNSFIFYDNSAYLFYSGNIIKFPDYYTMGIFSTKLSNSRRSNTL